MTRKICKDLKVYFECGKVHHSRELNNAWPWVEIWIFIGCTEESMLLLGSFTSLRQEWWLHCQTLVFSRCWEAKWVGQYQVGDEAFIDWAGWAWLVINNQEPEFELGAMSILKRQRLGVLFRQLGCKLRVNKCRRVALCAPNCQEQPHTIIYLLNLYLYWE